MGFSSLSDPYLVVAWRAGLAAVALVLLVGGLIVTLRVMARREETRWQVFVARWRPLLLAVAMEDELALATLPPLQRRDHRHFLRLWLYLHESIRGDAAQRLDLAARRLGLVQGARRMLVRGRRTDRLLAVLALGNLRDREGWPLLMAAARKSDPLLSVNAARALVQIDPFEAARQLMPLIVNRRDWDASRVAAFLAEARQAFWLLLVKALPTMTPHEVLPALRLAGALRLRLPSEALDGLLDAQQPPEVVCAALPLASDAEAGHAVRSLLTHPGRRVRELAAISLAPLAGPDDVPLLSALLHDPYFEVRMAAARALAGLPFLPRAQLERLCTTQAPADAGGVAALRHAMAEHAWA